MSTSLIVHRLKDETCQSTRSLRAEGATYQMKQRVIPDFKVVAEPDFEALLGADVVALVQLNLGHQEVS